MNFEIFIIKTLPDEYINRVIERLDSDKAQYEKFPCFQVVHECSTREKTLNKIINLRDKNKDTFIVADDIIFLEGWYDSLKKNYQNGDIIGFSMIDAKSGLLQNFGYDFVEVDGSLSYRGKYKGNDPASLDLPDYRECDAVTGCAMFIKSHVFESVTSFPLEGANRWGEILFSYLATQNDLKTIVISSYLQHYAISTKQKNSVKLSSLSWIVERGQWEKLKLKYLSEVKPVNTFFSALDKALMLKLKRVNKGLIYGCGVNADFILNNLDLKNWDVCSGLPEEIGQNFNGLKVLDVEALRVNLYDLILITPIGYDQDILRFFPKPVPSNVFGLDILSDKNQIFYKERSLL
jgi:hypothetical protein